ncbi:MAG TPA: SCO family protein [Candidatus Tyrphobacter sp.]
MRLASVILIASLAACANAAGFDGTAFSIQAPNVTLVDQHSRQWDLSAQRGTTVVLYFGYTHCPDDCPLTLAKLSRAIAALGPGSQMEIAFITVDPARDTPAVLATYIRHFHGAKIVGLTGSRAALARAETAYHVWAQRIPGKNRSAGYAVAHASPVFLIDANGRLRVVHDDADAPSAFTHDLQILGNH